MMSTQVGLLSLLWIYLSFCKFCCAPAHLQLWSILLTVHCLDKIHIFMTFRHHILCGSDVVAYKQQFAKDRQFNS